jgi:hypothetical protein
MSDPSDRSDPSDPSDYDHDHEKEPANESLHPKHSPLRTSLESPPSPLHALRVRGGRVILRRLQDLSDPAALCGPGGDAGSDGFSWRWGARTAGQTRGDRALRGSPPTPTGRSGQMDHPTGRGDRRRSVSLPGRVWRRMIMLYTAALLGILMLSQGPSGPVTSTDLPKPPGQAPSAAGPAAPSDRIVAPAEPVRTPAGVPRIATPPPPPAEEPRTVVPGAPEPVGQEDDAEPVPQPEFPLPAQKTTPAPASTPAPAPAQAPAAAPAQAPARAAQATPPPPPRSLRDEPRPTSGKRIAAFWMLLPGE